MRSRAIYPLLFLGILALAGCTSSTGGTQTPPLVFPTGPTGPSGPPPLSIYVCANGQHGSTVYSLNAQTGRQRWGGQSKDFTGFPYLNTAVLYFGAANGNVYAVDADSGAVRWHHMIGSFPSVLSVSNGVVYVGTKSFTPTGRNVQPTVVSALNASDGSLTWQSQVAGFVAATDTDTIYLTTPNEQIEALNASDGSLTWQFQGAPFLTILQIANGQVYVEGSQDNQSNQHSVFYALSASDGSVQWRYPGSTGDTFLGGMAVDAATVYLEANPTTGPNVFTADTVFALRVTDGKERWQRTLQGSALQNAYVDSGTFYTSSDVGQIYALNTQNGAQLWQVQTGNIYPQIETVNNGLIYAASFGEGLYVLNAKDGSVRWRYESDASVDVFTVMNSVVYAASIGSQNPEEHGTILGLNSADGSVLWHYDAGTAVITVTVG